MAVGSKTTYSPSKKWISDDEFQNKFDSFITKKPQHETRMNELFGSGKMDICESMMKEIKDRKRDLKAIV